MGKEELFGFLPNKIVCLFERPSPGGELVNWGAWVRGPIRPVLQLSAQPLVSAGEQLLTSVAKLVDCPLLVPGKRVGVEKKKNLRSLLCSESVCAFEMN